MTTSTNILESGLFEVYPLFPITLTKGKGVYVYDDNGQEFLDLYGGHGVISVGHSHPEYVESIVQQLNSIGFYSNSIISPLQEKLAKKLSEVSGYPNYNLFLCNSGTEANENAIKLASYHTGKKKVIAFKGSFHGRTAASLNITDNPKISAPINLKNFEVDFIELNDKERLINSLQDETACAVIIEGIQGVGGLDAPTEDYLIFLAENCKKFNTLLILDEIQSGYGRSGRFFAHQHSNIKPDIISMAKGMGNGFPIGGVLIHPDIKANHGLLGTTFGGNYLACAAGISVINIIQKEKLMENVQRINEYFVSELKSIPMIKKIKGKGLMMGIELDFPIKDIRMKLLKDFHIFTGNASNPNVLRILPPLCITIDEIKPFIEALKKLLK